MDFHAEFFAKNKGAQLVVEIESARFLTPDVLVEKGVATVGDETTRFVCNYVRKESQWLIAEIDETTLPPADAGAQALGELAWQVRSWMFDSEGGFGEGEWRRDANKWLVSFAATAPDGTTSTSQHVLTYVDDKKFTWESINRVRDGEALFSPDAMRATLKSKSSLAKRQRYSSARSVGESTSA